VTRYDVIGRTYTATRRTDPRIAARIHAALGDASTIVNVGAGTGNYEPEARGVVAADPSRTMLAQRAPGTAPAVQAAAEALPFGDWCFDAALAVFTVHHWTDVDRGLRELRRVAPRQVILTFDGSAEQFWLVSDYLPVVSMLDAAGGLHTPAHISSVLDVVRVESVAVPADCVDGFLACYWNRPEAYLDPLVQAGISGLARLDPETRERGIAALRDDLASGAWDARHGDLRRRRALDVGYRLVVAGLP